MSDTRDPRYYYKGSGHAPWPWIYSKPVGWTWSDDSQWPAYHHHSRVGAPPGVAQGAEYGTATADAYTYGAASEALSEGQAMAAWAALAEEQDTPDIKRVATAYACPSGWLISPDGSTCVNQRNVHVALAERDRCAPNDPQWFACSELSLWFKLHHQWAFEKLSEAKKMLPAALRELGYLVPNGWNNLKTQLHALARYLNSGIGVSDGSRTYGPGEYSNLSEAETESALTEVAASAYDAAIARGGDVPSWITHQIGAPSSSPAKLLVIAAAAVGAVYLARPALVLGAYRGAHALFSRLLSKVRS